MLWSPTLLPILKRLINLCQRLAVQRAKIGIQQSCLGMTYDGKRPYAFRALSDCTDNAIRTWALEFSELQHWSIKPITPGLIAHSRNIVLHRNDERHEEVEMMLGILAETCFPTLCVTYPLLETLQSCLWYGAIYKLLVKYASKKMDMIRDAELKEFHEFPPSGTSSHPPRTERRTQ